MNNILIDKTLSSLDFSLNGRDDFFLTTSFGYQSALLFFLFSELGLPIKCLFIKSDLSISGIDKQKDYITNKFEIDLKIIDRSSWLEEQLKGENFVDLDQNKKREICKNLKREPLLKYIKENSYKIWISGIRKDQTEPRKSIQFMEVTDLNVIKISPLFFWSREDIKNLIVKNNLKVNSEHLDLCKLNDTKECGLHF